MNFPDDYLIPGIEPYHVEEAGIIYCADCRDILPHLPKVDLVLTDPPYGIGASSKKFINGTSKSIKNYYEDICWDTNPAEESLLKLAISKAQISIIWGANYFVGLPAYRCFLVWDKTIHGNSYSDCELAWTNIDSVARIKAYNMCETNNDGRVHPTQKPLKLMTWCITLADNPQTILDPWCGSGTTLRAAKDLGRKSIGIEISEKYAEIAADRCRQEVLQF
jgi:DNA modification methylase